MEHHEAMNCLVFYVNGRKVVEPKPNPEMTLLTYLRTESPVVVGLLNSDLVLLTGSKLGCGEGGCGACTVMLSRYDPQDDSIKHYSANACLAPVCSVHGLAVTTVEGVGSLANIHPVQERIAKFHGSQCGFCTPGIVMSMYTLLRNKPTPSAKEIEEYFDGNLCRCTGYRPIIDGYRTFTKEFQCEMGAQCCKTTKSGTGQSKPGGSNDIFGPNIVNLKTFDPSQEPIFPPDLKVNHATYRTGTLTFEGPNVSWIQPSTLKELVELKAEYPHAKLIVGNTEIGIETKYKNMKYKILIFTTNIPELSSVKVTEDGIVVGGAVTLAQLDQELRHLVDTLPESRTRVFSAVIEMLRWFASHQIRNVASVSGNIMTASPISDLNPLFVAAGVTVTALSKERGYQTMKMDKGFFQGYRQTAVSKDQILVSITIPYTHENEYFYGYKQANRKEDDISLVNAGMMVTLSQSNIIEKISLVFGGMGSTTVTAHTSMAGMVGKAWDDQLLSKAGELLTKDLPLSPGSPGGLVEYRQALALSFFFKFYTSVRHRLYGNGNRMELSAITELPSALSQSVRVYGATDSRQNSYDGVGKSAPHLSALQQSTGEAVYVDDMLSIQGEVHMSLVTSTRPHAMIVSVDPSAALTSPGVVDYVSARDVIGQNHLQNYMDTVFAVDEVTSHGQVIGAIVADTQVNAQRAAKLVKVTYEDKPAIITIKDAIKHDSYFDEVLTREHGEIERAFPSCERVIEGESYIGGQNHFYMETMATRVVPLENTEMEVFCSTQNPSQLQMTLAWVLGVPSNKILIRTKRLGGGFGGKETQNQFSGVPAAVAAQKLRRPVRCVLERDDDMVTTGNRHSFLGKYKVGFSAEGKIKALDLELYANAGNSLDLSLAVMQRATLEIDSCYSYPNLRIVGRLCRTNIMSNTAFRGFGAAQGTFIMETIMDDVAAHLGLDPVVVRQNNFLHPEDKCHLPIPVEMECLSRCWRLCMENSEYNQRKTEVDNYNREHRWKKKGLAVTPLKYGISFLQMHMNQAGALVHIYRDGSVLVTHGGVEMGQGLHTKVMQIASEVLKVPMSSIHISETSTNTVPNTEATAASVSTDLNGMAVKRACETLMERLKPYRESKPCGTWVDWVMNAFMDRVSLSATGFYATPNISWDDKTQTGHPYSYYTYGAACSEVEIDCLTGDHKVLRTDIVMDVGQSINPAIDVGQIEGAFTQGYGLFLLEEVKVNPDGAHLTRGPGNYKIPGFGNIPTQFNVYLVPDSKNPNAVFFSRGVGEPPLILAMSVFLAVKEAIRAARKDNVASLKFQLNSPAVPARIRMACDDAISKQFPDADPGTYKPWFVDL